jgi:hypothetical protein
LASGDVLQVAIKEDFASKKRKSGEVWAQRKRSLAGFAESHRFAQQQNTSGELFVLL